MHALADEPGAVFLGQSVAYDGATIYDSLDGIPMEQRVEMPVIEDFQMGFSIGLALQGLLPISIYPRMDFLLLALNQLINHLDKMPHFGWKPKVIVRTRVGSRWPLNAGPQHTQDHTEGLIRMLHSVGVIRVTTPAEVLAGYERAIRGENSVIIVEAPT